MDLANIKVSLGIVAAIIVQAFGLIWYVAQLDSTEDLGYKRYKYTGDTIQRGCGCTSK